jgi:two-component system sensor histidine kinase/response regulator
MTAAAYKWSYVFDEPTRILMVDDDPILREFAIVHLSAPLSRIETVPDAAAALDLLSRAEFDIVLADIEMPGMDGFELVERIRAQEKLRHLPVVMITGREDIVSIDRAYTVGATSFVTKPINWRQLSYQLRYVVRASKKEADRPPPGEDDGAVTAISGAMRDELVTCLNAIIATANTIAAGRAPVPEAARAREIMAAAESALHKLWGAAGTSETERALASVQSEPPISRAG